MTAIQDLRLGQSAYLERFITEQDVTAFASLTIDTNPVHIDEAYAAKSFFGRRIAHGYLVGSLISAVLGTKLPGPGSIYLEQTMRFLKPVYLGDTVRATVTVNEIMESKGLVKLSTVCTKVNGTEQTPVIVGEATIKLL